MNRRDFLRRTVRGQERTLELSCERLYMRWADAQARVGAPEAGAHPSTEVSPWDGEPPLDVVPQTPLEIFQELEVRLAKARVLRVTGREWLARADFRHQVESRIEAFRRAGGRVE